MRYKKSYYEAEQAKPSLGRRRARASFRRKVQWLLRYKKSYYEAEQAKPPLGRNRAERTFEEGYSGFFAIKNASERTRTATTGVGGRGSIP